MIQNGGESGDEILVQYLKINECDRSHKQNDGSYQYMHKNRQPFG